MIGRQGQAGRGDGFAGGLAGGAFGIQGEEKGEDVGGGRHAVGGGDGGVEPGLRVAEELLPGSSRVR